MYLLALFLPLILSIHFPFLCNPYTVRRGHSTFDAAQTNHDLYIYVDAN